MRAGGCAGGGLAALAAGRWAEARVALEEVAAEAEPGAAVPGEVLDGLAQALWWLGEPQAAVEHRQRAYVAFSRSGDPARACWSAILASIIYGVNFGNAAAASGWLARAERILGSDPHPLQHWLRLMHGFFASEHEDACALLREALAAGRSGGDVDLELTALSDLGARLVRAGQVSDGLRMQDEALAGALAGECRHRETVVWVSCTMLDSCEDAGDLRRADQWLRVIDEFSDRYGCPFMYANCRTHYGSLLLAKGRWGEAERAFAAALRMSGRAGPVPHAHATAKMAELRVRQGRLEEAEALLVGCADDAVAARLHLVRGEAEAAVALLGRMLTRGCPPQQTAAVMRLLAEAQLAAAGSAGGGQDAAAGTVARLRQLARTRGDDLVRGHTALAAGRLAAALGDLDTARCELETAVAAFAAMDAAVEAAHARLALARACAARLPRVAVAEAQAALAAFERVGAAAADEAAALLRDLGAPGRTAPRTGGALTQREEEVLELLALGLSNPEIARRLFISRKTAAHHVSSVLAKLGVRNRAEAVGHVRRVQSDAAVPPGSVGGGPPGEQDGGRTADRGFGRGTPGDPGARRG